MGVGAARHSIIPISLRRSKIYLCCDRTSPFFDLATSIPRKYLSCPLTSKAWLRQFFTLVISATSSHVIFELKTVGEAPTVIFIKKRIICTR
jgi:hypothetical protein